VDKSTFGKRTVSLDALGGPRTLVVLQLAPGASGVALRLVWRWSGAYARECVWTVSPPGIRASQAQEIAEAVGVAAANAIMSTWGLTQSLLAGDLVPTNPE